MLSHAAHIVHAAMSSRTTKQRRNMETILSGIVSLLHEAGKLVLIEGVETEHEAQMALACDADFVQGFFFGAPAPGSRGQRPGADLHQRSHRALSRSRPKRASGAVATRLQPYVRAFERAAERLAAGEPLEEVCWNFLALDHAARCFLLDAKAGRRAATSCCARIVRRMRRAFCRSPMRRGRTGCAGRIFARRSATRNACM